MQNAAHEEGAHTRTRTGPVLCATGCRLTPHNAGEVHADPDIEAPRKRRRVEKARRRDASR